MRIVVTGATGLLGTDLCRLLGESHEVMGWARRIPLPEREGMRFRSVDVTDEKAVKEAFSRFRPDVVIHTAAMSDVDACQQNADQAWEMNVQAVERVARFCVTAGAVLIQISTDYVFDGKLTRPYREEDPPSPLGVYGRSKWEGEKIALKTAPRCLVIRVSGLFGSGRPNFVSSAVRCLKEKLPVRVVTDQRNSPSHTVDLSEGIRRLLELLSLDLEQAGPQGRFHGILHLANQGGATRLEVARRIAHFFKTPETLIEETSWETLQRPTPRPRNSQLDCGRFTALTQMALRSWEAALDDFLELTQLDPLRLP